MATQTYGHTHTRSIGGQIFLWLAWAAAAIFWGLTFSTVMGIMGALGDPAARAQGGIDAGGLGWGLQTVIGVAVLGVALAYGMMRYATRDKRKDPMTEVATAQLYDTIERQGGDDMTTRSPEARRPEDRDALRDVQEPNRL